MNMTGLILIILLYPFVFLMYALLKNEATPKSGLYYGVRLQKEQRKAEEVLQISQDYQKQMRKWLWIVMLIPLPLVFIPWFSIMLTLWMLWMLLTMVVFFVPFGIANKRMKELKIEKGWKRNEEQLVYAETKAAGTIRKVKWYHFLLPTLVSLAILIGQMMRGEKELSANLMIMLVTYVGITLLFWLMAVWIDRQKTQIISNDSDVNINYTRAKKNQWLRFWVSCTWINVCYMISLPFSIDRMGKFNVVFTIATVCYTMVTLFVAFWTVKKMKMLDNAYESMRDIEIPDDDDNWIWGMAYYNPRDKHSMIEKRIGVGTTINMASKGGKVFVAFCLLTLLSIPAVCVWCIMTEFTPIQLQVTNHQMIASHLTNEYTISKAAIQEIELLTELPEMSRNHGTDMDTLQKGSYYVEEEGNCDVFLNPQNDIFLRVQTTSNIYYLSGCNDVQTREVYERMK